MPADILEVPRLIRRGGRLNDVETSVDYNHDIIQIICDKLGLEDLSRSRVLDMGCGWRMAKTLLDHKVPIIEYVGMDVFAEMIEFLQQNVSDPRFSFHRLNTHNEMYNPQGMPLAELPGLDVPEASFDVICLFSVFTHLAPHDYSAMLKLLRPYIQPRGKLIFSLFVNESTDGGYGFIDGINRAWEKNAAQLAEHREAFAKHFEGTPDFIDFDPEQPLKWAIYSREHAIALLDNTGWKLESLNNPEKAIQHHMVCTPS